MSKLTPVNWTPWIQEALVSKANILSMGLVEQDTDSIINQGGKYFVRPYQENLREIANPVNYNSSTTITAATASDYKENLVVAHIGDGYYETEYDRITRGVAALDSLMLQRAEIVLDSVQDYLIAAVKGAFATQLATSHVYNAYSVGDGYFDINAATKAVQTIYGEDMDKFDAYIMSSTIYSDLIIQGTASYESASNFSNSIMATGKIPTFLGKRVLLNDSLCTPVTIGEATVYPIYIVRGQPLYLAWQRNVRVYEDFEPAIGGGKYSVFWYADFVPAVKGISWVHTSYDPSEADLGTGSYWSKVYEDKHITMCKVLAKVHAAS
jgi:hypothetical protein